MPRDGTPPPNLPCVVARSSAHVIAAVPLKPSAWILPVNPPLPAPFGERLRGVHTKVVEARIVTLGAQPRMGKPARRKLPVAVGHVLPAEHAEAEHLFRRELGIEAGCEVTPGGLRPVVHVVVLHLVVDNDLASHWSTFVCGPLGQHLSNPVLAMAGSG